MTPGVWLALFAAAWLISLSPGSGAVASMSAGASYGVSRTGWHTVGLILGIWTQVLVVGLGLGALIAASPWAFTAIKWAGVAYLIVLGVQAWRQPGRTLGGLVPDQARAVSRRALVLRGWAVNAVNPKGTLFLLAVVPQFVNLTAPLGPQYLIIAATLGVTDLVVMTGYSALAARAQRLLRSPQALRWMDRGFGTLFVLLAVTLAGVSQHG